MNTSHLTWAFVAQRQRLTHEPQVEAVRDSARSRGLRGTVRRTRDGDVLALFDDFIAYRADLRAGIARGRLVPFAYHGVRDDIDYDHISCASAATIPQPSPPPNKPRHA